MGTLPTMNDVARQAGVSLKTVSRYVNGETNVAPSYREKVAEAITALGYRRNLAAASIRPGWSSKTLGLIISDLANPYYSTLSKAIESYAADRGYLVISASSDESGAKHDSVVERLIEQRVDGLLVVPPREAGRYWAKPSDANPPLVFLDRPFDVPGADIVIADNVGGAQNATNELLDRGATRVAFVGDAVGIYTIQERYRGYSRALDERGIPIDNSIVVFTVHSSEDAAEAIGRLLEFTTVDAIFAANNRASVGALLAFRTAGRRVPLIGFDDFEAAPLSDPAVSVVSHDVAHMGRRAAEILLDRISPGAAAGGARTHVLPTRLVLRGSELA